MKLKIEKGDGMMICYSCNQGIEREELYKEEAVERRMSMFVHLKCFIPKWEVLIDFDEDSLWKDLSEADAAAVKEWIDAWNLSTRVVVPEHYLKKAVKTENPPSRRILLEVFLYLTPTEIEQLAAFACKDWLHITRDEELWRRQYLSQFPAPPANYSFRELAIIRKRESCCRCGKPLTLANISKVSPAQGRWLCLRCDEEDELQIIKLTDFCDTWCITYKLVKALQIPTFRHEGAKSVYLGEIRKQIVPYALSRRQRLIKALKVMCDKKARRQVMKTIKSDKLDEMYIAKSWPDGNLEVLCEFYGLAEEGESFSRSVRRVIRKLTAR